MKRPVGVPSAALFGLAIALTLGCQQILGVERGTLLTGSGGAGGKTGAGGAGGSAPRLTDNVSCRGLAPTCGPAGTSDCCASSVIPGGSFLRSYDGTTFTSVGYPATVSSFALDTYEITVGRFRKFAAAYSQDMIGGGSGKNPSDTDDPGWDAAWNANLPADAAALEYSFALLPGGGIDESLPMEVIGWYEAFAFCIWDGGRLPTEAEWNYAAAGGDEQRDYPWGSAAPDGTYAVANYAPASASPRSPERVGTTSPKGDGRWGQADLAGNVSEWNLDWYWSPYSQIECDNCASTRTASTVPYPGSSTFGSGDASVADPVRVTRGGSYFDDASALLSSSRAFGPVNGYISGLGARCARSVP